MPIISRMGEDKIRPELTRQAFEGFLYLGKRGREKPITERMDPDRVTACATEKFYSPSLRLALTLPRGTPDNPAELWSWPSSGQLE